MDIDLSVAAVTDAMQVRVGRVGKKREDYFWILVVPPELLDEALEIGSTINRPPSCPDEPLIYPLAVCVDVTLTPDLWVVVPVDKQLTWWMPQGVPHAFTVDSKSDSTTR